jgi:ABC-type Mn2+/Zn2+ transport system permease subunit
MLTIPAATAQLFARRLHHMMLWAALIGMVGSAAGLYISYHADIATGPAIVLTLTALFIVAFVAHRLRGGRG